MFVDIICLWVDVNGSNNFKFDSTVCNKSGKRKIISSQSANGCVNGPMKCYIIPVKNSSMNINEVCHCT